MKSFREIIEEDLERAFHNTDFFAENVKVKYDGEVYQVHAVIDAEQARERSQRVGDNAQGIFLCEVTAYIRFADLGFVPRKNHMIAIDGNHYKISDVSKELSEIILRLEAVEE